MTRLRWPLALAVLSLGCAEGKDPPAPTVMVSITEGLEFVFGTDEMCRDGQKKDLCAEGNVPVTYPTMRVKIKAFQIDQHEVTNVQYAHCVAKGGCSEPAASGIPVDSKYYDEKGDGDNANMPVVNVTWQQAKQYCEWVGKRLPTEYEWERAATGGEDKTPWGATLQDCSGKSVVIRGCNASLQRPADATGGAARQDVAFGDGDAPIYDLGGNVSEWVADVYDEQVTCKAPIASATTHPCSADGTPDLEKEEASCTNAHEECANLATEGLKLKCQKAAQCCEQCTNPDGGLDCFGQCLETAPIWICIAHGPDEVVDEPKSGKAGGDGMVRGGNYDTTDLCQADPRDRGGSKRLAQTSSRPTVGFRCAKDL